MNSCSSWFGASGSSARFVSSTTLCASAQSPEQNWSLPSGDVMMKLLPLSICASQWAQTHVR
ncbi:MAG TPA: hypothetical protein VMN56_03545 [Casimicrobiaceae bacterium]|nr:hypothetical protein [Casimicrobiaceae bacterium]